MLNKTILIFLLVFIPFTGCKAKDKSSNIGATDFQLWSQALEIENEVIDIYIDYIDEEKGIVKSFYTILPTDQENKKVLTSIDGKVEDSEGNLIIDLSDHHLGFYGYELKLSYPKNPIYTSGIILTPYFSSGESVGDSLVVQWHYETKTFQLRKYNLP